MLISLQTVTNQYDTIRIQHEQVRTDTTWHEPVRFNRDDLLATKSHAHPCLIASIPHPSNEHRFHPILVLCL